MKFSWIFLLILTISSSVLAQPQKIVGMGFSYRSAKAADQKYDEDMSDTSLFAQIQSSRPEYHYMIEFNRLLKETSEGSLSVNYTRYEINPWLIWDINPEREWHWFLGAGIGLSQEYVDLTVNSIGSNQSRGDFAFSLNGQWGVFTTFYDVFFTQLSLLGYLPINRDERDSEVALAFRFGYSF